ncbi:MAG: AzlD domain-containing protein [Ruminococcus flavefaciens]|nr:AzlD domain-containing protein [Ruminococcus flavefaciens]MCM1231084.1 AzlD domain-containing protein [Ruminococcus flavefaciens]
MNTAVYILVMAGVTYIIRMIPFTFFRKKIKSRFIRSFLKYIPYAVLSAMTIPSIFYSTGSLYPAIVGTLVAIVLALFDLPLIAVALSASTAVYIADIFI